MKKQSENNVVSVFDDLLVQIGEFGRYQRRIYFLLCLPGAMCALHTLAWVFVGGQADHRCLLPHEHVHNASYVLDNVNMSLPWSPVLDAWSRCERLDANFTGSYFDLQIPESGVVPCDEYVFDTSVYSSTAVMEFKLVCGSGWLRSLVDTLLMFGILFGSFIFGNSSDRFGRKPTLFAALVIQVSVGILASLAPSYISFIIFRLIMGTTVAGAYLVAYVLGIEMVGPGRRQYAGVLIQMFYSLGYMLTALFAFLITEWRHLQLAMSLPGLIFLFYWWLIPESPRWLLGQGRVAEASLILQIAASENKCGLSPELLNKTLNSVTSNLEKELKVDHPSLIRVFKYPALRRNMLIVFFIWIVNNLSYFVLSWNTGNLGGNIYINFVISGAVEIPAYIFVMFSINLLGRKPIQCSAILTASVSLILTTIVPHNLSWLHTSLAMLGKMAITASCGTLYILSSEIFPTCVRTAGIGAAATLAGVGSMSAPFIILLATFWRQLPYFILGCLALISGLLALLLPETLNKDLPDTIEEGEMFCKSKNNNKITVPDVKL